MIKNYSNSNNESKKITSDEARKQREIALAYYQSENLQSDKKVCVGFVCSGRKKILWKKLGNELNEALERIYKDNYEDCFVSISEFKEERLNEDSVASIKVFYVRLPKTEKFNSSSIIEGKNLILKYCEDYKIQTPSVIIYNGNEYCLKWILKEPLNGWGAIRLWKKVQGFLAEKFFYLLDEKFYIEDNNSPKKKFVDAHCNVTAMLRVPGFLNNQTKGVDLFNPKFETQIIFSSERHYVVGEIVFKMDLPKYSILEYRELKEEAGGYLTKKTSSRSKKKTQNAEILPSAETKTLDENLIRNVEASLRTHHEPREEEAFIYVQRKNIEKKARTDRQFYYDSYSVANIEKFVRRSDIGICDFWATAAEYKWGFYKLKEKKILRTRENGERYEEIRRQLPNREKWIEAIQLNFLHLNFKKSELGYIPTIEQAKELIYARCEKFNLPKPVIVDTGDNCETLELRWLWKNAMKNCGERDNPKIMYPRFNKKFDDMQDKLFSLFWDLGVDESKLKATSMLRVVGTPNTKTGKITNIFCEADEILTYEEFAQCLALNFGGATESEQSKNDVIEKRNPLAVATTLASQLEKVSHVNSFTKFANELAELTDFEILMTATKTQDDSSEENSDEFDEPIATLEQEIIEEVETPDIPLKVSTSIEPSYQRSNIENRVKSSNDDLSRLHSGSNYWACICTENKIKGERGKWKEYWTPADRVCDALATLRIKIPDFDEFNIYVSQLEFSERRRKVENVVAFRACFVDIDGKIAGGNLTADGWKNLILNFCREKKIPTPSEMVFSGNGVHVKFFFNKLMTVNNFSRWEKLEIKLAEIFKTIGADSHATDGARVLRVEGTKNCKPDTKDRDVRVIFTGGNYDFEKFASYIENFSLPSEEIKISEPKPEISAKPAEIKSTANSEPKKVVSEVKIAQPLKQSSKPQKPQRQMTDEEEAAQSIEDYGKTWFYLLDTATDAEKWIAKSDFNSYAKKLNKNHRVECSIVEFKSKNRHDRRQVIENLYFNYVILSRCPGETLEEKIDKIKEHCRIYRDVGIPEPNKIMEDGNKLILFWRYSKEYIGQELRGVALPRWKATQEYLSRHFEIWGALENSEYLKATALLPLPGFSSVKFVYQNPELKYIFDDVAKAVLPFTQEEVAKYNAEKKKNASRRRAIELEELTKIYVDRREADGRKSKFNPALKIFNDIVKLLKIRAENSQNGEVPEGRRELCVFCALDFAVPAGLVKREGSADFNELAQKLIDFCGESFKSDCTPNTMRTLRRKFLNDESVYKFKKKTLIKRLEITPEEQSQLDILNLEVSAKRKKIHEWEILGCSKATYYRRKEKERKLTAKIRERRAIYYSILWLADELARLLTSMKMRQKMRTYYEGERNTRGGACVSGSSSSGCERLGRMREFVDVGVNSNGIYRDKEEKEYGEYRECCDLGHVLGYFIREFFSVSWGIDFLNIRDGRRCRDKLGNLRRIVLLC